jgi:CII-binding regulator of phage lambda lysogenization HflD
MEDIARKIKYYQDDNLRLSNELVKLSNKLENTKSQLDHFENNKARLMSQLENLNNIISENNIIGSPFDTTISKVEDKSEVDKKIPNEKQITQNLLQKIVSPRKIKTSEDMNRLTKEIFKK